MHICTIVTSVGTGSGQQLAALQQLTSPEYSALNSLYFTSLPAGVFQRLDMSGVLELPLFTAA